mgnify:FL=1
MATRKKPGIRAKVKFYMWCIAKGIDLKYFDPHSIEFEPTKRVFSFYKDKQGTKDKYNYIFPDHVYNKQIREILNNN